MPFLIGCRTLNACQRSFSVKISNSNFKPWNIVFFGSDNFSVVSLNELMKERNRNLLGTLEVVTTSMSTPLYKFSMLNNIKTHLWPIALKNSYDIGVIVSFGKLIPKEIIEYFPLGIINVHPSLLPKWRGAMPITYSIKNGDTSTGITIQKISASAFDTGDIIHQKILSLGKNELYPSVFKKLSQCASECLIDVIKGLPDTLNNCEKQITKDASYARKLSKDVAVVRWGERTAEEIYNTYRALFGVHNLLTTWEGKRLNLICMSVRETDENPNPASGPGTFVYDRKNKVLLVNCKDKPVRVCTVFFNGKLYLAQQFYRGFLRTNRENKLWKFGD